LPRALQAAAPAADPVLLMLKFSLEPLRPPNP
jgi:hypothetical protein